MKKGFLFLMGLVSMVVLLINCKEEEPVDELKKINLSFQIKSSPSNGVVTQNPTIIPSLVFSHNIDYTYIDSISKAEYKIFVDSVFIKDSHNSKLLLQSKYSNNKTLLLIPRNDLTPSELYTIKVYYRFAIYDIGQIKFFTYIYKNVPQVFSFESKFSVGDFPYFDPDFVVTAHPSSGGEQNYLSYPYFTFNKNIDNLYLNNEINRKYKICIDSAGLYSLSNQSIITSLLFANDKDTLKLIPNNILSTNSEFKSRIKYHIEIRDKESDLFQIMKKNGKPYYDYFSSVFQTSSLSDGIDTSDVEYAYPSPYQYHFLRLETTRGVLKIKENSKSKKLSRVLTRKGNQYIVRFSSLTGQKWDTDATYDPKGMKFIFNIQGENFENQKIYKIEYVVLDDLGGESVLLTYHFRTSMFDKFEQKLASINSITYGRLTIDSDCWENFVKTLLKKFNIQEGFDSAEGKAYSGLVRFEAYRDTSSAWVYEMFKFYDLFEKSSLDKNFRPRTPVHIPPANAIAFNSYYIVPLLSEAQINSGIASDAGKTFQRLEFDLVKFYTSDYCKIHSAAWSLTNPTKYDIQLQEIGYTSVYSSSYYKFYIYYYAGDSVTYKGDWVILY